MLILNSFFKIFKNKKKEESIDINKCDYYERKKYAEKEKNEILNKYVPKEYQIGGIFTSKKFQKLEKELEEEIGQELLSIFTEDNKLLLHSYYEAKTQILKEKYNINWQPISNFLCDEYYKKCKEVDSKYKV